MSSPYLFTPVGSGGGSASASSGTGKNYLGTVNGVNLNGDFELGLTTGWSLGNVTLTSALPTGVPTFGSGASGNLSISAVTSGKLAGDYSLSYVSSAATTAGDFVASDAFTIDLEDQAKVMTFKFYYSPTVNPTNANWSGTASNSFSVAIYDVTNAAWIIPAGVRSLTQGSGVGLATGTFQTPSNGSQFRFVVFNSVATAGAITVLFDDFSLGPQTAPIGPVVTDWVAITPTISGLGTVTGLKAYARRVGDTQQFSISGATGTVAASTASITLPNTTIDYTKISSNAAGTQIGQWANVYASTARGIYNTPDAGVMFVDGSTTNQVFFAVTSGSNVFTKALGNAIFASSGNFNLIFSVPIAGWSSNVQMSNDTDTRVVAVTLTGSSTSINSSGAAIVPTTTSKDTHGAFSGSTFTCPVTGFYEAEAFFSGGSVAQTAGQSVDLGYKINGGTTVLFGRVRIQASITNVFSPNGAVTVFLNAGDTFQFYGIADVTQTISAFNGSLKRVTGPSVVAANESVGCRYHTALGASLPGSYATNIIKYTTKSYDTHNAYSTSTGLFTAPVSGTYAISGTFSFASPANTVDYYATSLKNGSVIKQKKVPFGASVTTGYQPDIYDEISLNAGETLSVGEHHGTAGSYTYSGNSVEAVMTIRRVGN